MKLENREITIRCSIVASLEEYHLLLGAFRKQEAVSFQGLAAQLYIKDFSCIPPESPDEPYMINIIAIENWHYRSSDPTDIVIPL